MANRTRRKRRDAWGSITELEKGRRYVIRYWASTDERGYMRHSETIRGTRADAERRRAELMLAHQGDEPAPTVQQLWERYALPDTKQRAEDGDVAPTTVVQYERWWRKHVEPRWASVACDEVRPIEVQKWLSGLTRSQAANATLVLTKAMDYAVRYGWCDSNPMRERYLLPGRSTVSQRDKGTWTLAELEGVWRRVHGTWMEAAFILAAFGSCRVGEALGPKAGEVELTEVRGVPVAVVPIRRQVEHRGAEVTDRMKTSDSSRIVVVAGKAATRLGEIADGMPPDWFLTNDGSGNPVSQARYTSRWRSMGMEHPFRNLRNGWQTWMRWEMRVAPYHIEAMMGHRQKGTTGQYYDRPQAQAFADVMAEAYAARPYDKAWELGRASADA